PQGDGLAPAAAGARRPAAGHARQVEHIDLEGRGPQVAVVGAQQQAVEPPRPVVRARDDRRSAGRRGLRGERESAEGCQRRQHDAHRHALARTRHRSCSGSGRNSADTISGAPCCLRASSSAVTRRSSLIRMRYSSVDAPPPPPAPATVPASLNSTDITAATLGASTPAATSTARTRKIYTASFVPFSVLRNRTSATIAASVKTSARLFSTTMTVPATVIGTMITVCTTDWS